MSKDNQGGPDTIRHRLDKKANTNSMSQDRHNKEMDIRYNMDRTTRATALNRSSSLSVRKNMVDRVWHQPQDGITDSILSSRVNNVATGATRECHSLLRGKLVGVVTDQG